MSNTSLQISDKTQYKKEKHACSDKITADMLAASYAEQVVSTKKIHGRIKVWMNP